MKAIAENPHIALKELRLANQVLLPVECITMKLCYQHVGKPQRRMDRKQLSPLEPYSLVIFRRMGRTICKQSLVWECD